MPPFTIAPWELPPDCDAPLTAPADFVFRSLWQYDFARSNRETEIWVRVVPYKDAFFQFFCDGEHPQNGNWVLGYSTSYPYSELVWDFNDLEGLFRDYDDLWYEYVSRLVYMEGTPYGFPGTYRLSVSPGGHCIIEQGTRTFEAKDEWRNAGFNPLFKSHRCPARAVTTKNQLMAAFKDENSEARFALNWMQLQPHERHTKTKLYDQEKLAPMRELLLAALRSQTDVWNTGTPLQWQTHEATSEEKRFPCPDWDGNQLTSQSPTGESLSIPPRLKRWKRAIWDYFIPSPDKEWMLFSQTVQHSYNLGSVTVTANPPTRHERLEARILLREWWQEEFAPLFFEKDDTRET